MNEDEQQERRQRRQDRLHPINAEENFRNWKAIVGLPSNFPILKPFDFEGVLTGRMPYLNPDQRAQADLLLMAALNPKLNPHLVALVNEGHGATTLAKFTHKRMTTVTDRAFNITPAIFSRIIPVQIELADAESKSQGITAQIEQGLRPTVLAIPGLVDEPVAETIAVLTADAGVIPQIMIDLSGFTGNVGSVVGEMKDLEEAVATKLRKPVEVPFGQTYFTTPENHAAMQSVYTRASETFRFQPFTAMEIFAMVLDQASRTPISNRYTNPAAYIESSVIDRVVKTFATQGRKVEDVRITDFVSQFRAEIVNAMNVRWSEITPHLQ